MTFLKHVSSLSLMLLLSACNEYWWTRGQPPATVEILERASQRIQEVEKESSWNRPDIAEIANELSRGIAAALKNSGPDSSGAKVNARDEFNNLEKTLLTLEGKLSYGNRAPFNELSGQYRAFKQKINIEGFENIPNESLKLFTARLMFLLASEMNVPAPDKVEGVSS